MVAMLGLAGVRETVSDGGRTSKATIGLWSEVVYEGIEVYRSDVTLDRSGESPCVAYKMRSVQEGTRFSLLDRKEISCISVVNKIVGRINACLYWSTLPIMNL